MINLELISGFLIKPEQVEQVTKGGIILLETDQEKPAKGLVVSVSKKDEELGVLVGDVVYYNKYAGTIIEVDRIEYLLVKGYEIMAVLKK